jgi:4-hydroxyphenylacetate 3-hydroxylase C terminal
MPNAAAFEEGGSRVQLDKFYLLNDNRPAEDRRKLLAFARDLLNSDYAGRRTPLGGTKIADASDASNCGVLFPRTLETPASAQKRILI